MVVLIGTVRRLAERVVDADPADTEAPDADDPDVTEGASDALTGEPDVEPDVACAFDEGGALLCKVGCFLPFLCTFAARRFSSFAWRLRVRCFAVSFCDFMVECWK